MPISDFDGRSGGCGVALAVGVGLAIVLVLAAYPQYRVYSQRLAGQARLAEAQSSRQVAILEARAKKESAIALADAEVIRAQGAAKANQILQDSLGGPEGYLRYLQRPNRRRLAGYRSDAASVRWSRPMIARLRSTRLRRIGLTLGGIAGGLLLLDLIGFVVTVYYHKELLAQAEAAGLGKLLER